MLRDPRMVAAWRAATCLALLWSAGSVAATAADPPAGELRILEAHPLTGHISVDGQLDEPDWSASSVATGFVQLEPAEGEPAESRTEVRVIYGTAALYIGAVLFEQPEHVRRPLTRRDNLGDADYFIVTIDGFGTGRSAYRFGVTAAGVQVDATEEHGEIDYSWDAVWESAVRIGEGAWTVEMAIPYSMLRFPRGASELGIQFQRRRAHSGERTFWQPVRREEMAAGVIAGRLVGMNGITPRRNIQVRPYTLSRFTRAPELAGPAFQNDTGFDVGADVKLALASNLILDATINPDFGQVEADPEVLNLTTFETFFRERRPFFLEGTSIFDYVFAPGDGPILHTRRIGGLGRIVGAGKLTGSTRSGTSFGLLTAATSDGFEDGDFTGEDFEPDLLYGAARVKHEFGERSFVGAALTYFDGFRGDFVGDHYRSLVGGLDWDYRFSEGRYRWESMITYNQRHFSDELGTPGTRGIGLYSGVDRVRGVLTGGASVRMYSPDFQPNDVGFFRQNDIVRARAWAQHLLSRGQPFGPFRLALVGASAEQSWTYEEQTNLGALVQWYSWWYFRGYERLSVRGTFADVGGVDVLESRGLGPVRNLTGAGITFDYSTDTRRHLVLTPRTSIGLFREGGRAWNVQLGTAWTASDRLTLSLHTRYERRDNVRAWFANEAIRRDADGFWLGERANTRPASQSAFPTPLAPSASAALAGIEPVVVADDFTDYYVSVFGARDQRVTDTSARATYTFRPDLSLQLYSQLFAARFRYDDFRLLANADDLRELDAYPRRRDETRRSLNLNAVLRWEYRPGSTVFLVWSHGRSALDGDYVLTGTTGTPASPFDRGTFPLAFDTFDLQPTNTVLIKLNYLLMR